jgi:hypothetical protein
MKKELFHAQGVVDYKQSEKGSEMAVLSIYVKAVWDGFR